MYKSIFDVKPKAEKKEYVCNRIIDLIDEIKYEIGNYIARGKTVINYLFRKSELNNGYSSIDDLLIANGIVSIWDFIEEELDEDIDESDSFIREFEDEIAQDELSYEQDEQPASFMNNIENIVNQAKEQLEHEEQAEDTDEIPILHIDEDTAEDDESVNEEAEQIRLDEEAEPEEDSLDVDDDLPALDGYGADEMDEQFAKDQGEASIGEAGEDLLAKYLEMNGSEQDEESSLIDEDDDNIDLMGFLVLLRSIHF